MTGSRNAFLSLIVSSALILGANSIIISGIILILLYLLIYKNNAVTEFTSNFIPLQLFSKFSDFNFETFSRFEIYKKTHTNGKQMVHRPLLDQNITFFTKI